MKGIIIMGFDLYGTNPSSEKGKHFRHTISSWYPLWDFVSDNCSDILNEEDIKKGNFTDGHFIECDKAIRISRRLKSLLGSEALRECEEIYQDLLRDEPVEACFACHGTGWLDWPKEIDDLNYEDDLVNWFGKAKEIFKAFHENPDGCQVIRITCYICQGSGKSRPEGEHLFEDNVKMFADFCADSGGFTIN